MCRGEVEAQRGGSGGLKRVFAGLRIQPDKRGGAGLKRLPGGGQGNASGGAGDKRRADGVLQCADASAEGGLRQVAGLGGAREVQLPREFEEIR